MADKLWREEYRGSMWLEKLSLGKFRSCEATDVLFSEDLTVLVGENASGKSAVIDALRIATTSAIEQKGISYQPLRDPTHGTPKDGIVELKTVYTDLTEGQKAAFMTQLVDEDEKLRYTVRLSGDEDTPYWKLADYFVGEECFSDANPMGRKRIAHIYLPPLRDAIRELDSGGGERLAEVLKVITGGDLKSERDGFITDANNLVDGIAQLALASRARGEIEDHLEKITPPTRKHAVSFGGRKQELRRLAGLMRVQLAESGIDPLSLASSGLGYANLLFIATIVLQLAYAKDYDLTLLLVEEPEAHLHPQLQAVLLDYLKKQAEESHRSVKASSLVPEGRVQVIVSTHSPNLASSISVDNIVIVSRHVEHEEDQGPLPQTEPAEIAAASLMGDTAALPASFNKRWSTKTTALRSLGLKASDTRKLDRYLSVTRSSLLFARHIVLVEGIAEAMLIPEIARTILYKDDEVSLRLLASTSFVPIDGVDFRPYLTLLLGGEYGRVDHVSIITDGDPDKKGNIQGEARKETYEKEFSEDLKKGRLSIHVGKITLEADLFGLKSNEVLLFKSYKILHPQSTKKWNDLFKDLDDDVDVRAKAFSKEIRRKKGGLDLGKGEFAQLVIEGILKGDEFVVPAYIQDAIKSVVQSVKFEKKKNGQPIK